MTPERQDELVAAYAKELRNDLTYAAPEMWPVFIRQAMEDLVYDVLAEDDPDPEAT